MKKLNVSQPPSKVPGSNVSISGNDRVLVVGQTGSGKTVLSMSMLYKIKRLLVVDSKDSLAKWNLELPDSTTQDKIRFGNDFRIRVVNDQEAIDYLELIYKYGDVIIYIDEVNAIIPPRKNPHQVFVDIWQRGRERGIGAWAATQRPVSIPVLFLTEAYHFFIFRLNNEEDRKRVAGYTDKKVLTKIPDQYGFYYYDVIDDKLRYTKKLPI